MWTTGITVQKWKKYILSRHHFWLTWSTFTHNLFSRFFLGSSLNSNSRNALMTFFTCLWGKNTRVSLDEIVMEQVLNHKNLTQWNSIIYVEYRIAVGRMCFFFYRLRARWFHWLIPRDSWLRLLKEGGSKTENDGFCFPNLRGEEGMWKNVRYVIRL